MNQRRKFVNFLESLKNDSNSALIESVKTGYSVCFEGLFDSSEYKYIQSVDTDLDKYECGNGEDTYEFTVSASLKSTPEVRQMLISILNTLEDMDIAPELRENDLTDVSLIYKGYHDIPKWSEGGSGSGVDLETVSMTNIDGEFASFTEENLPEELINELRWAFKESNAMDGVDISGDDEYKSCRTY
jgi:hypothetical protein